MTRFVAFVLIYLAGVTSTAFADCGDSESPMAMTGEFGVSACRPHAPRYDAPVRSAEPARYASAEDPMAWSDDQWRTSLFDYNETANGAYDRRGRATPQRAEVEIVKRVVVEQKAAPTATVQPRGPKLLDVQSRREITARPGVLQFEGHKCRGVLVLTVGEAGTIARCKVGRRFQMMRGG